MKKIVVIILLLIILIPSTALAWSWRTLFFGDTQTQTVVPKKINELDNKQKLTADERYKLWESAFDSNDLKAVIASHDNFIFSEAELNYFANKAVAAAKNPDVINPKIVLDDNLIKVSGYSYAKHFTGAFEVDGRILSNGQNISLQLDKVVFRGITIPGFLINKIINNLVRQDIADFMKLIETYPNYNGVNVVITSGQVELRFAK